MSYVNKIYYKDGIDGMRDLDSSSINLILCDLPYGLTARNTWDIILPMDILWEQYKRILVPNGAVVLTAVQPFSSFLVNSNLKWFKYELIWVKSRPVNFLNAKKQPLRKHESVLLFYNKQCTYNPQNLISKPRVNKRSTTGTNCNESGKSNYSEFTNYPNSILEFASESNTIHPTQKPLSLFEYLIRTYSNEGDIVLDHCSGSGTTCIAAKKSNRNFIGFENNEKYYNDSVRRLNDFIY